MLYRILIKLTTLILLMTQCSGCAVVLMAKVFQGNGEGYEAKPTQPTNPDVPKDRTTVRYFRIKPNYMCPTKDGTKIKSYKDSLVLNEESKTFTQTGDKCATSPIGSGNQSELDVVNGKISYKGGIYQKEEK